MECDIPDRPACIPFGTLTLTLVETCSLLDFVTFCGAIGLHIWNQVPVGEIGVNRTTVFASADAVRITVRGRGGHGALPHLAVDPVTAAAQIISAAQTVISRSAN